MDRATGLDHWQRSHLAGGIYFGLPPDRWVSIERWLDAHGNRRSQLTGRPGGRGFGGSLRPQKNYDCRRPAEGGIGLPHSIPGSSQRSLVVHHRHVDQHHWAILRPRIRERAARSGSRRRTCRCQLSDGRQFIRLNCHWLCSLRADRFKQSYRLCFLPRCPLLLVLGRLPFLLTSEEARGYWGNIGAGDSKEPALRHRIPGKKPRPALCVIAGSPRRSQSWAGKLAAAAFCHPRP